MSKKILILVLVLALAAGLGGGYYHWWTSSRPRQVIDQHRAGCEPQIALVEAVGRVLDQVPQLEQDGFDPRPELDFFGSGDATGNVAFMCVEDFDDLCQEIDVELRVEFDLFVCRAASLLRTGCQPDGSPPRYQEVLEEILARVEQLRYLLVMRTLEYVAPEIVGEDEFTPGRFVGELHLFALDGARHLGGLRIRATNDDTVEVRVSATDSWLRSNLWERVRTAVDAGFREHLPGVGVPFGKE